jgi:flavin reductase (DIM6/NTAB) family NADH-FMN oxidoreductase RutF
MNQEIEKQLWRPGNMLYPVPAVMVSCQSENQPANIITIAWTGTVCTNPPMVYISVRPERHSYKIIQESGEFVINLTTQKLAKATDYCGVKSGRDVDKWKEMSLHQGASQTVHAPAIQESPIHIECKVQQILPLGSHHMFLANVTGVQVDPVYLDEKGKLHMEKMNLVAYSHGEYYALGDFLGKFGYSVQKVKNRKGSV